MKAVLSNYASKCFFATIAGFKQSGKFIGKQALRFLGWLWNYFTTRTMDVQIAIALSVLSVIAMQIATTFIIVWFAVSAILSWMIVWREFTWPSIVWAWKESLPVRQRFAVCAFRILFGKFGFPVMLFSWGIINLTFFGVGVLYGFSPDGAAGTFGIFGLSGIIFGAIFYAIEKHIEKCKIRRNQ